MGRVDFMRSVIVSYQRRPAPALTRTNVSSLPYSVQCSKNALYIYGYIFLERERKEKPFFYSEDPLSNESRRLAHWISDVFFSPFKTDVGPSVK